MPNNIDCSICSAAHSAICLWETWGQGWFICWEGHYWDQEAVCTAWWDGFE